MSSREIDTGTSELQARLEASVLTLTLNRPEARNAMTATMVIALGEQLALAETNDEVRCVVLSGAGKGFCAGGDVKGMSGGGGNNAIDDAIYQQRLAQHATAGKLFKIPKPTLAAINGAAAGAGLSLALACDFRIMSTSAFLLTAFAKVGLSGDFGGTFFMTQLIGAAKAREFYFLSDRVDAAESLRLGLTNWTCAQDELQAQTTLVASRLAAGPSVAYRYMKQNLNRAIAGDVDDCLDVEATHHVHCMRTEDHKEAAQAFIDKREPVFKAR